MLVSVAWELHHSVVSHHDQQVCTLRLVLVELLLARCVVAEKPSTWPV